MSDYYPENTLLLLSMFNTFIRESQKIFHIRKTVCCERGQLYDGNVGAFSSQ